MLGVNGQAGRKETAEINFLTEELRVTDIKEIISNYQTNCL
jgi:hypothetical protein